jgi:thiosulfate/3-mercaptopyruvate sulfurtransferase
MQFRLVMLAILASLVLVGCGDKKAAYNYIDAPEVAQLVRENSPVALVDIQVEEDFNEEHLKGAIPTYAFPVNAEEEVEQIVAIMGQISPEDKVVVVCPKGGGGAERAVDVLVENGIAQARVFILTDGQYGWPRDEISDILVQDDTYN